MSPTIVQLKSHDLRCARVPGFRSHQPGSRQLLAEGEGGQRRQSPFGRPALDLPQRNGRTSRPLIFLIRSATAMTTPSASPDDLHDT
jgi:hypothetical protein